MGQGRLTTHILDTATGSPAAQVTIVVSRVESTSLIPIREVRTNADGRTDEPVLAGGDFQVGVYQLDFHAGSYLRAAGNEAPSPQFLDVIPIQFGVADADQHFHVPLLLSPYGYSTYRGS